MKTLDYYQKNAQTFFDNTVGVNISSLYDTFTPYLPQGGYVLDAGCGSGRDALAFRLMGYQVDAFDASEGLAKLASQYSGVAVEPMTFADVNAVQKYDGIWCCASLLHVPYAELPDVMARLARALKPGGIWYASFKYGEGEREKEGRRFSDMNESRLAEFLNILPDVEPVAVWTTPDVRADRGETWLNALLRKG